MKESLLHYPISISVPSLQLRSITPVQLYALQHYIFVPVNMFVAHTIPPLLSHVFEQVSQSLGL